MTDTDKRRFAREVWGMKDELGADFSDYQMDADDALKNLGLLRDVDGEEEYGP